MIKDWLASYNPADEGDATHAMREIMQEVALAGLYRKGFFEKAAFYGGTALRIFYGLDRFFEDLNFSLLKVDRDSRSIPTCLLSSMNSKRWECMYNQGKTESD